MAALMVDASGVVHSSVSTEEPDPEPDPEPQSESEAESEAPTESEASDEPAPYEDDWTAWGRRAVLGLDGYRIRYPGPVARRMLYHGPRCRVVLTEETHDFTENA